MEGLAVDTAPHAKLAHSYAQSGAASLMNTTGNVMLSTSKNTYILCLQNLHCGGTEN